MTLCEGHRIDGRRTREPSGFECALCALAATVCVLTLVATMWLSFAAQALAASDAATRSPAFAHVEPFLHAPADERPVPVADLVASFLPRRAPDRAATGTSR